MAWWMGGNLGAPVMMAPMMYGMFGTMIATRPQILAGKVRALGVTAAKRSAALPDVPTMIEQGFPAFEMYSWHGVYGPANLPKEVVGTLTGALSKIMQGPEARERLSTQGFEPIVSTSQQFMEFQKKEFVVYERLIREGKIAQMYSSIQTGQAQGMQTLDQNLADLVRRNIVSPAEARAKAKFPENFPG